MKLKYFGSCRMNCSISTSTYNKSYFHEVILPRKVVYIFLCQKQPILSKVGRPQVKTYVKSHWALENKWLPTKKERKRGEDREREREFMMISTGQYAVYPKWPGAPTHRTIQRKILLEWGHISPQNKKLGSGGRMGITLSPCSLWKRSDFPSLRGGASGTPAVRTDHHCRGTEKVHNLDTYHRELLTKQIFINAQIIIFYQDCWLSPIS